MFYLAERQSISNPYPMDMLKNTTASPMTLRCFCMTWVIAGLLMYMIIAMKVITTTIKDWRYGPTLRPTTGETESEEESGEESEEESGKESGEEIPKPKIRTPTLEEVLSSGRGCGC